MAFKKGQSGNPGGRKTEKLFTDALRLALNEEDETTKKKKLRLVAEKLIKNALEGDNTAIKEIADRIEGKPQQTVEQKIDASVEINLVDYSEFDPSAK